MNSKYPTIDELLPLLSDVVPVGSDGNQWNARCPAHDDNKASLSIGLVKGKVVVNCHAGCESMAVYGKLGFGAMAPKPQRSSEPKPGAKLVVAYDYCDVDGKLVFQSCRFEPKDFRQRQPGLNGDWIWNMKGVKKIPYRLPAVTSQMVTHSVESSVTG